MLQREYDKMKEDQKFAAFEADIAKNGCDDSPTIEPTVRNHASSSCVGSSVPSSLSKPEPKPESKPKSILKSDSSSSSDNVLPDGFTLVDSSSPEPVPSSSEHSSRSRSPKSTRNTHVVSSTRSRAALASDPNRPILPGRLVDTDADLSPEHFQRRTPREPRAPRPLKIKTEADMSLLDEPCSCLEMLHARSSRGSYDRSSSSSS